jgi:GNAT superfamily N-acetyltransferase
VAADKIQIRDALPQDWPPVGELLRELGRPSAVGTDREEELHEVYTGFLSRPDAAALVAEEDGRVVGFCDLLFVPRLNFAGPQAWIPDLVVAENDRGRGIGAALLSHAEDLARDRGCWSIFLSSANWRTRSHAFYRRAGWDQSGQYFSKSLTDEAWPPPPPAGGARSCPR